MKNLKFLLLILIAGIASMNQSMAQTKITNEKLRLGIKGALSISSLSNTSDAKIENARIGFNMGLFAKVTVMNRIAIQPELYIATKGATMRYNNSIVNGKIQYNFNYIELPVFAVVNITPNFNLHAGPYGGILLSGNTINESNITTFDVEHSIDKDNYNRLETGVAFGGGLDIGAMSFGLRYYKGLTKVGKERSYTGFNYTFPNSYNNVFNAYLNFSIN